MVKFVPKRKPYAAKFSQYLQLKVYTDINTLCQGEPTEEKTKDRILYFPVKLLLYQ
jgi:hypothetical protein